MERKVGLSSMKDFCEWLGVSDKIAKLIIWLFVGMCFLIVTNIMLESVGLPYYKITVENLSKINTNIVLDYLFNWSLIILDFILTIFLVFKLKDVKKILPYLILYLFLNIVIKNIFGSFGVQIFIPIFTVITCYVYSKRNWKYLFYGFGAYLLSVFVQYICYLYKLRFVNYESLNEINKFLTSIDYFIILIVIILVKNIILKRREENKNGRK